MNSYMPKNGILPKIYQTRQKNKHTCLKCDPYMPKKLSNLPTYQPTCLKSGHTCLKSGHTCLKSGPTIPYHTSPYGVIPSLGAMVMGPGPGHLGEFFSARRRRRRPWRDQPTTNLPTYQPTCLKSGHVCPLFRHVGW